MINANNVPVGTTAAPLVQLNRGQSAVLIPAAAISVGTKSGTTTTSGATLPANVPVPINGMVGTLYAVVATTPTTCAVIVGDAT